MNIFKRNRPVLQEYISTPQIVQQQPDVIVSESNFRDMMIFKHPTPQLISFYQYLQEVEHSEENMELWLALRNHNLLYKRYKKQKHENGESMSQVSTITELSDEAKANLVTLLTGQDQEVDATVNVRKIPVDRKVLRFSVKTIFRTYLMAGVEKEVNLPNSIRLKIRKLIEQDRRYDSMIFIDARESIYQLMLNDSYPRYLKSKK